MTSSFEVPFELGFKGWLGAYHGGKGRQRHGQGMTEAYGDAGYGGGNVVK